jgi:hypothetical protein
MQQLLQQATQGRLVPGMQQQQHLLQLLAASRVPLQTGMHISSTTSSSSSKQGRQVQLLLGSSRHMQVLQVLREPHQQQQQQQQVVLPVSQIRRLT